MPQNGGIEVNRLNDTAAEQGSSLDNSHQVNNSSSSSKFCSAANQSSYPMKTTFLSQNSECAAVLYKPDLETAAPIVISAHGLGAVKEMGLDRFAARFRDAGYAVFCFDYRFFGESGGSPRQVIDIGCQLQDWRNAITHVKKMQDPAIDSNTVILFGTSFSGGHVIQLSSETDVSAVIAQCPFTNGISSAKSLGVVSLVKLAPIAIYDSLKLVFAPKSNPTTVKLGGKPGSQSFMPAPDYNGYYDLIPEGFDFCDRVGARLAMNIFWYQPGSRARNSKCPLYVSVCMRDTVAPAKKTLKYLSGTKNVEYKKYDCGHFDIYVGSDFEEAITDYQNFLYRTVPVK